MTPRLTSSGGFSLFEVLLALVILAAAIVPVMEAAAPSLSAVSHLEREVVLANRARGTMNRVLDLDFGTLAANIGDPVDLDTLFGSSDEALEETFSHDGISYVPVVAIEDNSEGDSTLLQVSVVLDSLSLVTLKTDD